MKTTPRLVRRCPHADCPSQLPGAVSRVVGHSYFATRKGPRRRLLCKSCARTFVARLGTVYYRLRSSRDSFDLAMRLSVEGLSQAATARAQGVSPATIGRWRERAAYHARRFTEEHLKVRDPVEMQLDELRSLGTARAVHAWVYNALEVWSRAWVGLRVGLRTLRSPSVLARQVKACCGPLTWPVLVSIDEFKYYGPVLRRTFGRACVHVQVKNRYRRDQIVRTRARVMSGEEWCLERALARSEDSRRPNTSYVERLNLFQRRSCSYLQRRTPAPVRKLEAVLEILRCYYNFVRPHAALRFGRTMRTPAQQLGLFRSALTFRKIFNWVLPPPRPALAPAVWRVS
jgi:transposase-like protein